MGAAGVVLVLASLFLLTQTVQRSDDFDRLQDVILAINIVGGVILTLILIGNLWRLLRDYRENVPGAKLKARMVGMFVGLAVLPLIVVFYFSIQFINRGIDSWFNVQVEEGLDNALTLSRAAIEFRKRQYLFATSKVAEQLAGVPDRQLIFELGMLRRESGANEMTLYGDNNQVLATSSDSAAASMPKPLTEEVALQLQQDRPFVSLEPLSTGSAEIRTAVTFMYRYNRKRDIPNTNNWYFSAKT
jgi:nitrogen fixation/metabolism regulation signal transduction histidine kinase